MWARRAGWWAGMDRRELSDTARHEGRPDLLTFVGNATVLMRCGGFTILIDPNFVRRHEKVGLGHALRATRLTDPALEMEDLPSIDLVLLSALGLDTWDAVTVTAGIRSLRITSCPGPAQPGRRRPRAP